MTLYQGDHSSEYLICEMKNNKVEGRCQLFNRGILSLAWVIQNGKRVGGITEYENGKALQKESWDSLLKKGDRRLIENTKGKLKMKIRYRMEKEKRKEENKEKEKEKEKETQIMGKEDEAGENKEIKEETIIYQGEFDEEMNRDGYGMEYDIENGKEKIEGYWSKDILVRVIREFDADNNIMIEYDQSDYNDNRDDNSDKDTVELLNRVPIYIGGYCISNGMIMRHGVGYLIDEDSGTAIRESEWDHGKEKKGGVDLYEGWYVVGIKESIRSILKNEEPGKMTIKPTVDVPAKRVVINNSTELIDMDLKVTDLVITSNACNDLNVLDLSKYKWLQSIDISSDCCGTVETFKISKLHRLKTIKIGNNSFTQAKNSTREDKSKSFHILNCESLESIQIGQFSFSDYAGEFELKNLPKLQSIQIGSIGSDSRNFWYSSFVVRGIDMILNI